MPGFLQHDDDELAPSETPGKPPTAVRKVQECAKRG